MDGELASRLDVLKASLARKEAKLDERINAHFQDVKAANGQPLNDKREGGKTLSRWDRQNDAIRKLYEGVDLTKRAIEREEAAMKRVAEAADELPPAIRSKLDDGTLIQWRKHPRTFFVAGVDKARMVLLDDGRLAHRYVREITDAEQRRTFARTYNALARELAEPEQSP